MKRIIICIVIISMMVLAIGCTQPSEESNNLDFIPEQNGTEQDKTAVNEYQALIFAYSDSASQLPLKTEIKFALLNTHEEESQKDQTKEFEFLGNSYQATYRHTFALEYDITLRRSYENEEFIFSAYNDGTVVSAIRKDIYLDKENVEGKCSEEQCLQVAKAFFEDTFDSIENYRIEVKNIPGIHSYEVRFIKVVDLWQTTEETVVWVSDGTGEINGYRMRMPNQFSTDEIVNFDKEKVQATVNSRLDEFYKSTANPYDKVEYEKMEYLLTKTEGGEYAIICEAEVRCYQGGASYGDIIKFLVTKV